MLRRKVLLVGMRQPQGDLATLKKRLEAIEGVEFVWISTNLESIFIVFHQETTEEDLTKSVRHWEEQSGR
ncbi:MAG: hypothetical protein K6T35_06435 [Meiothermus silvanus]|uniref:hypothetical protein n=1 Tax=Allomeiothermus silvanus TaxID=52022 RepID=UPI00236D2489|nr:hypothetical protein [Allomeiothermus silvanus]MCL6568507.1 hypothetical protein [Allomeiothermus silvanus]